MFYKSLLVFALVLVACGPNKELATEKFDSALKARMDALNIMMEADSTGERAEPTVEQLMVTGICDTTINAAMRKSLIDSGAEGLVMKGRDFTASVSSANIYSIGALDFVKKVGLQKGKNSER